jgi:hypothetical protein
MFPWNRIREDLRTGFERARKGILLAPQRILQEADILKLTMDLQKKDERIRLLYMEVGRRMYEKYKTHGASEYKESGALELFDEIGTAISDRNYVHAELENYRRLKADEQNE